MRINEFVMDGDIAANGQPFGYDVSGRDPQLIIKLDLPAGFLRFCIALAFEPLPAMTKRAAQCQIFLGDRFGFREENSYTFDIGDEEFRLDAVIHNDLPVDHLRFDPVNGRSVFRILDFTIDPLHPLDGAAAVVKHLAKNGGAETLLTLDKPAPSGESGWTIAARLASGARPLGSGSYETWRKIRTVGAETRTYLQSQAASWPRRPLLSVLLPVYRTQIQLLREAINSVLQQTYADWELCIVDDGSESVTIPWLLRSLAADPRIKIELLPQNVGIAEATNAALALATGEFVLLFDHDDLLAPHALHAMARTIVEQPDADMIYSDEDKVDMDGNRYGPFFKPDWSPEFMLSCMYTCHLGAYRTELVCALGGFRRDYDFAQDYDLALRISEQARRIVHIPDVLYHWRAVPGSTALSAGEKPTAARAAQRALTEALRRRGLKGEVLDGPVPGMHRIRLAPGRRKVSIVIPTAGRRTPEGESWLVLDLVRSIRDRTTYPSYEILVLHNGDLEPELETELIALRTKLVHYDEPVFNLARKINAGVRAASGPLVLLLNDDMQVISDDWLTEMAMWLQVPGIAGVGAKLFFPDGTVQHAGVLLLEQGPSHPYYGSPGDEVGLVGSAVVVRNYSAVTGACLLCRRADYLQLGGFDPAFRINYNDVDFCLRLLQKGRIVYTPYATLTHYEAISKGENDESELHAFNERWGDRLGTDPAYNHHLSQTSAIAELTPTPRPITDDY